MSEAPEGSNVLSDITCDLIDMGKSACRIASKTGVTAVASATASAAGYTAKGTAIGLATTWNYSMSAISGVLGFIPVVGEVLHFIPNWFQIRLQSTVNSINNDYEMEIYKKYCKSFNNEELIKSIQKGITANESFGKLRITNYKNFPSISDKEFDKTVDNGIHNALEQSDKVKESLKKLDDVKAIIASDENKHINPHILLELYTQAEKEIIPALDGQQKETIKKINELFEKEEFKTALLKPFEDEFDELHELQKQKDQKLAAIKNEMCSKVREDYDDAKKKLSEETKDLTKEMEKQAQMSAHELFLDALLIEKARNKVDNKEQVVRASNSSDKSENDKLAKIHTSDLGQGRLKSIGNLVMSINPEDNSISMNFPGVCSTYHMYPDKVMQADLMLMALQIKKNGADKIVFKLSKENASLSKEAYIAARKMGWKDDQISFKVKTENSKEKDPYPKTGIPCQSQLGPHVIKELQPVLEAHDQDREKLLAELKTYASEQAKDLLTEFKAEASKKRALTPLKAPNTPDPDVSTPNPHS